MTTGRIGFEPPDELAIQLTPSLPADASFAADSASSAICFICSPTLENWVA